MVWTFCGGWRGVQTLSYHLEDFGGRFREQCGRSLLAFWFREAPGGSRAGGQHLFVPVTGRESSNGESWDPTTLGINDGLVWEEHEGKDVGVLLEGGGGMGLSPRFSPGRTHPLMWVVMVIERSHSYPYCLDIVTNSVFLFRIHPSDQLR